MMSQAETVILLHGLGRSAWSMRKLQKALSPTYHVLNQNYPSQRYAISELADLAVGGALDTLDADTAPHFVTHSLGGILVREFYKRNPSKNIARCVMLGPPNQGSELADYFSNYRLFRIINGAAGMELGTGPNSTPNRLGAVDFECGVIAGNKSFNRFFSSKIMGEDDGKVSVERSKLNAMTDHLVLPVTHTFMMNNPKVIQQVKNFLANGKFDNNP